MRKLTDLCDIQYGYAFDSSYFTEDSSYIPIVRIRDVKRGFSKTHYSSIFPVEYVIHKGDLLVGMDGEFNIAKWQSSDALLNQRVCKLTAKEGMNKEYLRYAMIKALKDLENKTSFVTVKHLTAKELNRLELNVPSVAIQNQRENTLSALEKIMHFRSKQLKSLDDLIKARFIEMFGDGNLPMKTVEKLCSCVVDCPHTTPKYEGNLKNPAIRTSEIKKGFLVWDTMRYVSDKEYVERTTRAIPKAGDIVYGREGTFGNAAILPDGYKFCLGQRVMLLRPDYSKCTSEYLLHSVISDEVYRQAIEKNNASTVAHVNVKDVKQFKVPLPTLDKQNEFANFVKQVDKSRFDIKKSITELEREVVYD